MSGSSIGKIFNVTTWGESHGKAIGCVVDGCPPNISLDEAYINSYLKRRRPNQSDITTTRNEKDSCEILSGIFNGKTTGTPICVMVKNNNQISKDYENIKNIYRPSHADFCYDVKYGIRDYRGGGRSSGRETIGRVIAGAIANKVLECKSINATAYTSKVGSLELNEHAFILDDIYKNPLYMPNSKLANDCIEYIKDLRKAGDSVGGTITCIVKNMPVGIGEPVFRKLDALLSYALFSIGGVKAVEIGLGAKSSSYNGTLYNDEFDIKNNKIVTTTNNSGGILGGISNGNEINIRVHFKPTPSISKKQQTVTSDYKKTELSIEGRHDPVIFPRAVVVVESMVNIVICDLLLEQSSILNL